MIEKKDKKLFFSALFCFLGIILIGGKFLCELVDEDDKKKRLEAFLELQTSLKDSQFATSIGKTTEANTKEGQDGVATLEALEESPNDYVAVIRIPKLGLEKGLCAKDTSCNNISKNIEILKESDYPDVANGNFILAGHSGSGRIAYFRELSQLDLQDQIEIVYRGKEYRYLVVDIYEVEKNGSAKIIRNQNQTTLTLITCKDKDDKQLVLIAEATLSRI
ncbi:MAG: sortase [Candidatus Saccharibacteria bacterium]|nr:sortase [Candidatus Saccharibacteria bacterium]